MLFVKSFKGYEDRLSDLDQLVNGWITRHQVDVVDVKTAMAHEPESRSKMGDLVYTVVYRAEAAFPED